MSIKQDPIVFLSSVVTGKNPSDPGLAPTRRAIHELIQKRFGWTCICSGVSDSQFWGAPLSACLDGVDRCDLFIGIFWYRTGFIVDTQGTAVTEMEVYRALNQRKLMRLYILDSEHRDPALITFLELIKGDPYLGEYVQQCSLAELMPRLALDLESFWQMWNKSDSRPTLHRELFTDALCRLLRHGPTGQICLPVTSSRRQVFDKDVVTSGLSLMERLHAKQDHVALVGQSQQVLRALQTRPPSQFPQARPLWVRFLTLSAGALNWLAHLEGNFGAIAFARALMETTRLSEDFSAFHASAGIMSNCLYTLATAKLSRARLSDSAEWRCYLRDEAASLFKRALVYNSVACFKSTRLNPHDLNCRASILLHSGDVGGAVHLLRQALRMATSAEEGARLLGELGRGLVISGSPSLGMKMIDESCQLVETGSAGAMVRSRRVFAEALLIVGDVREGAVAAELTSRLAVEHGFLHQALVCDGLAAKYP
jgi:hypothetical protein